MEYYRCRILLHVCRTFLGYREVHIHIPELAQRITRNGRHVPGTQRKNKYDMPNIYLVTILFVYWCNGMDRGHRHHGCGQ